MIVTYCSYTQKGDREKNEDRTLSVVFDATSVFAVADGLGGHLNGDFASNYVVECLYDDINSLNSKENIIQRIQSVHTSLVDCQIKDYGDVISKTTLALLQVDNEKIRMAHVGDSRIYVIKDNELYYRTTDHSVAQALVNAGEITHSDLSNHPDRNKLLRVLGNSSGALTVSYKEIDSEEGYYFVLCSDGFWELIDENTMLTTLREAKNIDDWMRLLLDKIAFVGKNKTKDNISIILVRIVEK